MVVPYLQQASAARTVFDLTVVAFIVGEVAQALRVRRGAVRADLGAEVLFRAVFFGAVLLIPAGLAVAPGAVIPGGGWTFSLGVLVAWSGLLLRWWCFAALGTYFTVVLSTSPDQPIVERGPYGVLRHPSYAAVVLAFVGCGLMVGNWVSVTASVALVLVALVHRIRVEERALYGTLGDRYRDYAAGRARLVPGLW